VSTSQSRMVLSQEPAVWREGYAVYYTDVPGQGRCCSIILGAYLILKPWFDKRQLFYPLRQPLLHRE